MADRETRSPAVIVGVDGSAGSDLALKWAMAKEGELGPVIPVSCYHVDLLADGLGSPSFHTEVLSAVRDGAEDRLAKALADHPGLIDRAELVYGHAGPALVDTAKGHALLVVGSRGRGVLAQTVLGSVASHCVKRAPIPVAVIPEGTAVDRPLARIVVGVDGSSNADRALAWAADHLAPDGELVAVACRYPAPYGLDVASPMPLSDSELRAVLEAAVDRVLSPEAAARTTLEVRDGDPRLALREVADDADLLVLGARGHRGVAYLLLGSVTSSLIHHPVGPTVVVPG